jgi:exodeoxyribonuclease VII small subunit
MPAKKPAATATQTATAAASNNQHADVAQLSYEQARDELVEVVRKLEAGGTSLEDSLALWERGECLAQHCQGRLDSAHERLAAATADQTRSD